MKYKILIICFLFASCTKTVTIDMPAYKPQIVVNAILQSDSIWKVNVSKSNSILDNKSLQSLNDANITITDNDNSVGSFKYDYNSNEYYLNTSKASSGKTYKIKVAANGFNEVNSECTIPSPVSFTLLKKDSVYNDKEGQAQDEIHVKFIDPAGIKNYYMIQLFSNSNFYGGNTLFEIPVQSDDPSIEQGSSGNLLNDKNFDGKNYDLIMHFNHSYFNSKNGQYFYVIFSSLSESYYQYNKTVKLQQENNDNPFSEPVQVFTNISGGLGIFAGYSSVRDSVK